MRKVGIILVSCLVLATDGFAASRVSGTSASTRTGATSQRVRTQTTTTRKAVRVTPQKTKTISRSATTQNKTTRSIANRGTNARSAVISRATTTTETRTGAEYEQCKSAYFACMDQFCQLKNDEYRRCSCSDRIISLQSARNNLQQASEQLTAFNENLDIVGKTAAQATAMNSASDGELALTKDNSASKALLTAIMNSIRGTDSHVEHSKLSDLNSVDLSFDSANSFGTMDAGQTIASYNGQALYSAVYPQCRTAVKSSCNDASLQRAVNAYLMAIEQDCNTVQTAITNKQKETHAAIRESSSMLDMARAENHKAHNSDNAATCLANVESAILSEEVCGANYHKCLDNGEYIDVTTGAPISGVVDFYKLGTLLTFNSERNNEDQKLAQNSKNRTFVNNFEKHVKQFAEPALDKCVDDADTVWTDYLNKAMLDIYYAQQSKVKEIKQGCFDFVSACYMNSDTSMTNAMQGLIAAQTTTLTPDVITLNKSLCSDYIASCNNMFDGQIVAEYIENRQDTDVLTACRAVAKQCFDNYGGTNYENFYYPSSGLFAAGDAPKWFSLYNMSTGEYESECAKQLAAIDSCSKKETVEQAFGGFDYYPNAANIYGKYGYARTAGANPQKRLLRPTGVATEVYNQIIDILQTQCSTLNGKFMNIQNLDLYSSNYSVNNFCEAIFYENNSRYSNIYNAYSIGKSTQECKEEISLPTLSGGGTGSLYDPLGTSGGTSAWAPVTWDTGFGTSGDISATINLEGSDREVGALVSFTTTIVCNDKPIKENMCPRDYGNNVDTRSWGACLCWENGGRRSNNGTSTRCVESFPVYPLTTYNINYTSTTQYSSKQMTTYGLNNACNASFEVALPSFSGTEAKKFYGSFNKWNYSVSSSDDVPTEQDWCNATVNKHNQVCPFGVTLNSSDECNECRDNWTATSVPGETTEKCCPSGYTLETDNTFSTYYGCCPSGYNLQSHMVSSTEIKYACCESGYITFNGTNCVNSTDNTTSTPVSVTTATDKTSDLIKQDQFPEG